MAILPTKLVSETFLPRISLVIIMGKRGHQEVICFAKFSKRKQLQLPQQNLPTFFVPPQLKAKAPQPSIRAFPTKGNSSKNVKKKEHNVNKREVLQAHVAQIQILQMNSNH
jgi:hypothetical protein